MGQILRIAILVFGLLMACLPKICVKQEYREDETRIKKTRRNGFILTGLALIWMIAAYVIYYKYGKWMI